MTLSLVEKSRTELFSREKTLDARPLDWTSSHLSKDTGQGHVS